MKKYRAHFADFLGGTGAVRASAVHCTNTKIKTKMSAPICAKSKQI